MAVETLQLVNCIIFGWLEVVPFYRQPVGPLKLDFITSNENRDINERPNDPKPSQTIDHFLMKWFNDFSTFVHVCCHFFFAGAIKKIGI